jgi:hypothetical protein
MVFKLKQAPPSPRPRVSPPEVARALDLDVSMVMDALKDLVRALLGESYVCRR